MAKVLTRVAVGAALAAAVFAGTTSPALADTNKTISFSHGRMTYIDDGDMFQVCDTNADGYGVTGYVYRYPTTIMLAVDDGGDAGCDKGGVDITNSSTYMMVLYWNGGGNGVASDWFNE